MPLRRARKIRRIGRKTRSYNRLSRGRSFGRYRRKSYGRRGGSTGRRVYRRRSYARKGKRYQKSSKKFYKRVRGIVYKEYGLKEGIDIYKFNWNQNTADKNGTWWTIDHAMLQQSVDSDIRRDRIQRMIKWNDSTLATITQWSGTGSTDPDNNIDPLVFDPTAYAFMYWSKIYIEEITTEVIITNQSNTTMTLEMSWLRPRTNLNTGGLNNLPQTVGEEPLLCDSLHPLGLVSQSYESLGMANSSTQTYFNDYINNPDLDFWKCFLLFKYWKIYKRKVVKILPGQQKKFYIKSGIKKQIRVYDVEMFLALPSITRSLLMRVKGSLQNDTQGNVFYSDYNMNVLAKTIMRYKTLPPSSQINYCAIPNSTYTAEGDVYTMNPISGIMETEVDTRTGPPAASSLKKNSGIPVVVTNDGNFPVITDEIPLLNKKMDIIKMIFKLTLTLTLTLTHKIKTLTLYYNLFIRSDLLEILGV